MSAGRSLRGQLASGRIVMAPGAPDMLTARLVERAGFPAVYMTGLGATAIRIGMPDIGLLTQTEMADHARAMARAVTIPIVADADTGYGGPSNIERTVREYEQAGVAALHLEDQVAPKRCGQMAGIRLVPEETAVRHLKCALAARSGAAELVVIARTDALPAEGIDAAVRRARLYRDAGADLVFVDGIRHIADVEAVARRVEGPKVVSIVDGNETVGLTAGTLQEMGFAIALYPMTTLFVAAKASADALTRLAADGGPAALASSGMSYADFTGAVGLPHHQGLGDRYGS